MAWAVASGGLVVGYLVWFAPFVRVARLAGAPATVDRRARWGVLSQAIAFAALWQGPFWRHPPTAVRIGISWLCLACACVLSSTASRALGRHFRVDAGLSPDHALVETGPYRVVRHPIYASMLCVLLATAAIVASWPYFLCSLALFVLGTEIRVGVEDGLLGRRFGTAFRDYRRRVRAYVPLVR